VLKFFMKALSIFALALWLLISKSWGQVACRASVRSEVQVSHASVSLADLLMPDPCPELLAAAERVRLGSAPLRGSPRVMLGEQVRALLETIARREESLRQRRWILAVPERVVVRVGTDVAMPAPAGAHAARTTPRHARTLVNRGQTTALLWEQGGVRLTVPATCLESGDMGDTVRARITRNGRVIRAVVLADGGLRAIS
jgi:Chaperone for flagella basal body P-ring formation